LPKTFALVKSQEHLNRSTEMTKSCLIIFLWAVRGPD